MAQLCVLRVADMPVCFENNLILAFKGRSSRLAKRESFMNIVAIVPSRQKSHGISKNESLAGWGRGGGGGGWLPIRLASCYDRHSWQQMSAMAWNFPSKSRRFLVGREKHRALAFIVFWYRPRVAVTFFCTYRFPCHSFCNFHRLR